MSLRAGAAAALAVLVIGAMIAKGDGYQLYIIALVGLTTIVGVGLNVLLGLTGQISLGHVAFYAIGAYVVGILTTGYGVSFWLALPLAAVMSGVAGLVLSIPALRVRGPYLAMVTIAFGFVVEQGAAEMTELTGGWNGLSGIEPPRAFGHSFSERDIAWLVLVLTVLALVFFARLRSSPWGKIMQAVKDSELASLSIGIDPTRVFVSAFAISAVLAGLAGGVFASMSNFISPESFPFFQSILFLLVVMVGGSGSVWGPLIGALVVVLLPELLSALAQYRLLFVGGLMLLILRLAPSGLVGLFATWWRAREPEQILDASRDVAAFLQEGAGREALVVNGLSVSFGGVRAVRDVSFQARPRAVTSIIGPNGAGKTTALNLLCGFYRPTAGQILLGDADCAGLSSYRVARAGIARTFQTSQLFSSLSVIDNILVALRRGRLAPGTLLASDRDPEHLALAAGLLDFVGYRGSYSQPAGALAHVDKRLVEIARALALRPRVLTLDEPAAGLDAKDTAAIGPLLRKIADAGLVVLLIEHDMPLVMGVSDHVVVLDAGMKIAEGAPAAVASDPAVLKAYLGEGAASGRARKVPLGDAAQVLDVKGLFAGYQATQVLHDVNLSVRQGEAVAVLGANGAGKSTLMRALSGLLRSSRGEVTFSNERIEQWRANEVSAHGLVLVPEGRQVFPQLSVSDNIRLGGYALPAAEVEAQLERMLERFPPLRERRHQQAGFLSGGEQQMLAIARGLMARPRVLMLDEPSLGLAPKVVESLYDLFAELRDEGVTLLVVDQMATLALSVADRAYILQSGTVTHSGEAKALSEDPALAEAYLGGRKLAEA